MDEKNNEERLCEYIRDILRMPESAVLDMDVASLTQEQQALVAELQNLGACLLEQKQRLEASSYTDALTGVGNRLGFDLQVRRLSSKRLPCTVAFIDIDDLKYCNDHAGHREGDFYIIQVSRLLQDICKEKEQVFRIGGDEFVILSLWATEENLNGRLEAARDAFVRDMSQKVSYPCGFSFGCTQIVDCTLEAYDKLLLTADRRMYQYKLHQKRLRVHNTLGNKQVFGNSYGLESRLFDAMAMTIRHRYIFVCNMNNNISRWSANAVRDFNLPGEYMEDAGSIWSLFIHPDDRQTYKESIDAVFSGKSSYHDMEYRVMNAKGFYVMCSCNGYRLKGRGDEPDLFIGTIVNKGVIETVDSVTSLHNVYEFMNYVNKMRHEHKIADVLVVGITEFNVINDTYGYSVGNEILRDLAQQLLLLATNEKRLFRLNGMRMAFFLPESSREEVERFNEEVVRTIKNKVYFAGKPIKLYIASAATRYDDWEETPATLLSELDFLLECSKKERGGKLVYMDAGRNSAPRRRLAILNAVKRGILNDCEGFHLVYQPQIDIRGHTVGAEALLRWDSPIWGTVPPAEFIPWLEKDISFYDLGLWILKQALRDGLELLKNDSSLTMSVNISYKQLERETFLDDVLAILKLVGFPAKNLVLEFTEHCRTMDIKKLQQLVNDFRKYGLRIAQDDFGTGYSSLMLLRDIHFDIVKIDQNFTRGMLDRKADRIIVDSVIECAHRLDTEICVEGVETEGLLNLARGYDAEFYQGYVIARPLELAALKKFVENRSETLT